MDPFDHIRRAVADTRSGSVEITLRAAAGLRDLRTRRDIARAARALLRAHPAMAPLWRLLAEAYDGGGEAAAAFAASLESSSRASADGARWIVTKRASVVLTHSASGSVAAALARVRGKVSRVLCTASLPGGEGRAFARRLERDGFATEVVPDAAIARACAEADVALVGADAVTEQGVVNKLGTRLVALAARDAGTPCYAVAASGKLLPGQVWERVTAPTYELTALELFDAVLTERGPQRPGQIRRAVARVHVPEALERMVG